MREHACVRTDSDLSEVFEVKMGIRWGSVWSPFPFSVVVDVVTELVREGVLCGLLHADDLILMSEIVKSLI